jgi:hypothetical protein
MPTVPGTRHPNVFRFNLRAQDADPGRDLQGERLRTLEVYHVRLKS